MNQCWLRQIGGSLSYVSSSSNYLVTQERGQIYGIVRISRLDESLKQIPHAELEVSDSYSKSNFMLTAGLRDDFAIASTIVNQKSLLITAFTENMKVVVGQYITEECTLSQSIIDQQWDLQHLDKQRFIIITN